MVRSWCVNGVWALFGPCFGPRFTGSATTGKSIALTQQAILRASRLESGLFTTCLNEALDRYSGDPVIFLDAELSGNGDIEITRAQNRNYAAGEGFHRMVQPSNSWSLFIRYQAQAERHYRRAVEEFDRLKALRQELPGEANYDPQPEPKEPLNPTAHEPVFPPSPAPDGAGFPERPLTDPPGSDPSREREGAAASEFSVASRVPGSTHSPEHYPAATRPGADLIGSTPRD